MRITRRGLLRIGGAALLFSPALTAVDRGSFGAAASPVRAGDGDLPKGDWRETDLSAARGVYRSLSSAHWAEITARSYRSYSASSQALVLDAAVSHSSARQDIARLRRDAHSGRLAISWGGQLTPELLKPEPAWPETPRLSRRSQSIRDGAVNAEAFLDLLQRHHANRAALSADLSVERAALTAAARRGDRALFEAMVAVLEQLEDGHGSLWRRGDWGDGRRTAAPEAAAYALRFDVDDPSAAASDLVEEGQARLRALSRRRGGASAARGKALWWIKGEIGYLAMLGFDSLSSSGDGLDDVAAAEAAYGRAFADFQSAQLRGLVLDLRLNSGGWDGAALALAARLTEAERPLFTKKTRNDGALRSLGRITVAPAAGPRFTGPVAVLQSGLTVSAAEVALLALGALPNCRSFGWASYGAFSDAMGFRLPNGWRGSLSNQIYETLAGEDFERIGAPADAPAPPLTGLERDFWDAFDQPRAAAIDWLRRAAG